MAKIGKSFNKYSFAYFPDIVKPDIPSESLTPLVFAIIVIKWVYKKCFK